MNHNLPMQMVQAIAAIEDCGRPLMCKLGFLTSRKYPDIWHLFAPKLRECFGFSASGAMRQ